MSDVKNSFYLAVSNSLLPGKLSNFIFLGLSSFLISNKTKISVEAKSPGQFAIKMPPGVMNAARQTLSTVP